MRRTHFALSACLALVALPLAALPAEAGKLKSKELNKLRKMAKVYVMQQKGAELAQVLEKLAGDDSKKAVQTILQSALSLPEAKVLDAAVVALGKTTDKKALEFMAKTAEKKGGAMTVKVLCVDAFALMQDKRSAKALAGALKSRFPEVQRAALAAVRKRKPKEAVPTLIDLYEALQKRPDVFLNSEVTSALMEITGKWFDRVSNWRKYWEKNKHKPRKITGGIPKAAARTASRKKVPKFFGSEIRSERLVFVIDTSGSMTGDRIQKCKTQLKKAIEAMSVRSRFTVIAFSNQIRKWKKGALVPATPANKADAMKFTDSLQATGTTFTASALKEGFKVKGADTMIVLSDGAPTETNKKTNKPYETTEIMDEVAGTNRFKKWRIDTFGFGATGQFGSFLKELAEKNGGKFTSLN